MSPHNRNVTPGRAIEEILGERAWLGRAQGPPRKALTGSWWFDRLSLINLVY